MTAVTIDQDPYLSGVYAPVDIECDDPELEVSGRLPEGLRGTFLRNGPNPMFAPKGRYHIFDGDGMVHAMALDGEGGASYRNRWVRTEGLAVEQRAGRAIYGGMAGGTFPTADELDGGPPMKNVANTNVVRHAGRILCLWEADLPTEVTPSLETVGTYDFGGAYRGAFSAHPKIDPVTGEMLTFGYSGFAPHLRYHEIDAGGSLTRSIDIDLPAPVMIHDFAVTERHAVFFDSPAVFDFEGFAQGGTMLSWKPDNGMRIGVLDRGSDSPEVTWIETDPCYVFHFLNAFSTSDDKVVVDACRLPRMDIGLEHEGDPAVADSWLHRFTIDLATRSVAFEQVAELPGDFPRVPAAMEGRRHRYGYYASFSSGRAEGDFDSVTKVDLDSGLATTHRYGSDAVNGEAVFAPDPSRAGAEDGGWLLNYVTDRTTLATDFVVLDADTLDEVARVHLPQRVPFGFHGNWLPASA